MKVLLEGITKRFPNRNKKIGGEVTAVRDFTLDVPDGSLVGLLGPSGCGKSTVLNMICGLLKPTEGKIYFGDDDITALQPENRGVGLVFQNYALYPHMTVQQNIMFPMQNFKGEAKLSRAEMEKRALEAARLVQIDALMERKPSEMSGGQQQRVAIARALVKNPKVLLLDEPLSNLDARLRLQTREEIRRIQRKTGVTTIFVTHDQEEAMSISDLIVVMKLGQIQQTGKPQEVYDNPKNMFVAKFLGTPAVNMFDGRIENGTVYIGDDPVMDVDVTEDRPVYVGIRPEGFEISENGRMICDFDRVEVMGRDVSVVSRHAGSENESIRSIVDSRDIPSEIGEKIRFDINPEKMFLFDRESEDRIFFSKRS